MKYLFHLLLLLIFATCGCGSSGVGDHDGALGAVAVHVKGEVAFNPNIEHGHIEKYIIAVTGDGIAEPIEAEFPGDAEEGIVDGVPVGKDRDVAVEARNPNGQAIYAGDANGVDVGGGINDVSVSLESVPIFTNLADGNAVDNTRLVFGVYSVPSAPLVIEATSSNESQPVVDAATALSELYTDASSWLGNVSPHVLPAGDYSFTIRNLENGRMSVVHVRLLDGRRRIGAPLSAASDTLVQSSSRLGPIALEVIQ